MFQSLERMSSDFSEFVLCAVEDSLLIKSWVNFGYVRQMFTNCLFQTMRRLFDVRNWYTCDEKPPKGAIRPVLKHGPRSLAYVQVCGIQSSMRNESDIFKVRKIY